MNSNPMYILDGNRCISAAVAGNKRSPEKGRETGYAESKTADPTVKGVEIRKRSGSRRDGDCSSYCHCAALWNPRIRMDVLQPDQHCQYGQGGGQRRNRIFRRPYRSQCIIISMVENAPANMVDKLTVDIRFTIRAAPGRI